MKRRIFAEFDNVDSAENAARWIKNSYESVERIQISECAIDDTPHEGMSFIPNMRGASNITDNSIIDGIMINQTANGTTPPAVTPHAICISITTDGGWQGIETTLRAFGGRNIHALSSNCP